METKAEKFVTVAVTPEMHRAVRIKAAATDQSMSAWVRQVIEQALPQAEKPLRSKANMKGTE